MSVMSIMPSEGNTTTTSHHHNCNKNRHEFVRDETQPLFESSSTTSFTLSHETIPLDSVEYVSSSQTSPPATLPAMVLTPPPPTTPPTSLLDKYKIFKKIYGTKCTETEVYLVTNRVNPTTMLVAKVFSPHSVSNSKAQQTIRSEVASLTKCGDHLSIIRMKEYDMENELPQYIITEFAKAGDLQKEIAGRRASNMYFTAPEVAKIFVQLCLALEHVHSRGILHRDVKPANVFLTPQGIAKLGDFGLSVHSSVSSHACGTPYYLAPEIWRGECFNYKADLWGLGAILYEVATLTRPFHGSSMEELGRAIVKHPYVTHPSLHPDLDEICRGLLVKDPTGRKNIREILKAPICQKALKDVIGWVKRCPLYPNTADNFISHASSFILP